MIDDFLAYALRPKASLEALVIGTLALVSIFLVGVFDYYVLDVNFFLLYTLVVMGTTLLYGQALGVGSSLLSSFVMFFANQKEITPDNWAILGLDFLLDFTLFLVVVFLLFQLKNQLAREKQLARQDYLTGIGNRRAFNETLKEWNEGQGREFSLCYIDINDFNLLWETRGSALADKLVKRVARHIRSQYARVFRYEEDRFTLLLEESSGDTAYKKLLSLRTRLNELLKQDGFNVEVSVGMVLVTGATRKVAEILDALFQVVTRIHTEG